MPTILMPMAGLGSRFTAVGESRPKPVIPVHGVAMFRWALASVRMAFPKAQVICVLLEAHRVASRIDLEIQANEPDIEITAVPALTGGSLETCLAGMSLVRQPDQPIVILDCDLTFQGQSYLQQLGAMETGVDNTDGLLISFRSQEPRFSYAEVNAETQTVIRTSEKNAISDRALIGAYGFAKASRFFDIARQIVAENERSGNGEFYVSAVYNRLLGHGGTVGIVDAEAYWSMGTPEELDACLADSHFAAHTTLLRRHVSETPA
jgi:dTDP-glucose pyrophosphorylase